VPVRLGLLCLTGTSFIPHFGHSPGLSDTTSGCIGQVYFSARGAGDGEAAMIGGCRVWANRVPALIVTSIEEIKIFLIILNWLG
jgi:hypothetical protein